MKLLENEVIVEKSDNDMKSSTYGISKGNEKHIFRLLNDKLYTDKILAVIREYCANALDANMSNGKGHIPLHVHLPSTLDPVFKVRDFGKGLTFQQVVEVFTQYGSSTKRDDDSQIGALGIGSKAAFCYIDSWTVRSITKGIDSNLNDEAIYVSYKGTTEDSISLLSTTTTAQDTGIEIIVSVKSEDVKEFCKKAYKLFEHWTIKPIIFNGEPCKESEYLIKTVDFLLPKITDIYNQFPVALMGSISYKLDISKVYTATNKAGIFTNQIGPININNIDYKLINLINILKPVLFFKIGEVSITASREELEYTKETIEAVKTKLTNFRLDIIHQTQFDINKYSTIKEARDFCKANKSILEQLNHKFTWNHPVHGSLVIYNEGIVYYKNFMGYQFRLNGSKIEKTKCNYWTNPSSYRLVVSDSLPHNYLIRIKRVLLESGGPKYVMVYKHEYEDEKKSVSQWLSENQGYIGDELLDLDTIIEDETLKDPANIAPKNKKHSLKCFKFLKDLKHQHPYSTSWDSCDIDLDTEEGFYIIIDKFCLVSTLNNNNFSHTPNYIGKLITALETIEKSDIQLYGIKKSEQDKIKSPFLVNLEDYIEEFLQKAKIDNTLEQIHLLNQNQYALNKYKILSNLAYRLPNNNCFNKLRRELFLLDEGLTKKHLLEHYNVLRNSKASIDFTTTIDNCIDEIDDNYRLLKQTHWFLSKDSEYQEHIIKYVNAIDQK